MRCADLERVRRRRRICRSTKFELELEPPPGKTATMQFTLGQNQRIAAQWGEA
jgi:hypothetical protein